MNNSYEPPEPVFTFEVFKLFGPILVGCGAGSWLEIIILDSGEWQAALMFSANDLFWLMVIVSVIYVRHRRDKNYHRRIKARLESNTDVPARN